MLRPDDEYFAEHGVIIPEFIPNSTYCVDYARFCSVVQPLEDGATSARVGVVCVLLVCSLQR